VNLSIMLGVDDRGLCKCPVMFTVSIVEDQGLFVGPGVPKAGTQLPLGLCMVLAD